MRDILTKIRVWTMRVSRQLLTRLEGEVELKLVWERGAVKDAYVIAPSYRGFEEILPGRPYLDALVITPRVCGICGHAHLIATVRAIENAYINAGVEVRLTEKAKLIRDITLSLEKIQNHLRWFYVYLMPDFFRLTQSTPQRFLPLRGSSWRDGIKASNWALQALASFAGQWPHSSYAVPGGITSDPMDTELLKAESSVLQVLEFFLKRLVAMEERKYLSLRGEGFLKEVGGDLSSFIGLCRELGLDSLGKSYGRFIAAGEPYGCVLSGEKQKKRWEFHIEKVKESEVNTFFSKDKGAYTWTKSVRYNGLPYEAGPLARQIATHNRRIYPLFKEMGDSFMVRVLARMDEVFTLCKEVLEKIRRINLSQESWIEPKVDTKSFTGKGLSVIEASRGTLIHRVEIRKGVIKSYDIITPTVWNLGPRDDRHLGVVEKALIGLKSSQVAALILRSFDVCSVCTTH